MKIEIWAMRNVSDFCLSCFLVGKMNESCTSAFGWEIWCDYIWSSKFVEKLFNFRPFFKKKLPNEKWRLFFSLWEPKAYQTFVIQPHRCNKFNENCSWLFRWPFHLLPAKFQFLMYSFNSVRYYQCSMFNSISCHLHLDWFILYNFLLRYILTIFHLFLK